MLTAKKEIEVRYAETDQMGVVYHANYLVWMEIGRTSLIEKMGFKYSDMENEGILAPVMDVNISYKSPVKYGDTVTIHTWMEHYDGLRTHYGYEILLENGKIAATALTKHVCVKRDNFRPVLIRKFFPEWHEACEAHKKVPEMQKSRS
ncbi:acyl-CoA thioesterase [Jeotgalibacillus salarius]|uniref:Acyl-CoA thioesterase n=1 Tax=Jeotgalibacillus salarius TaxID=546023 RepID=A0A4Y8LJU2_9BACL|nr:thioesterase family protein [Jeotgalibacillus salarius]TFE02922.1 acyl-CoA thioesterase [Jeotgalibacillus salarius]